MSALLCSFQVLGISQACWITFRPLGGQVLIIVLWVINGPPISVLQCQELVCLRHLVQDLVCRHKRFRVV